MGDDVDSLLIEVRAGTQDFSRDIAAMRREIDSGLGDGLASAGNRFERSLAGALRSGNLRFDDLKTAALSAFDAIASQGVGTLLGALGAGGASTSAAAGIGGALTGLLGLPGRATGGNVAPGRGYVVGERGPELFVPTSAGRIEPRSEGGAGRDVKVAISIAAPRGASAPRSLERSSRQIASSVRRALTAH